MLYHYQQWIHEDLQELWMLYGQGVSSRVLPIHEIADSLESDVISALPAVHALTRCDSTSKIVGKQTVLKVVANGFVENLLQNLRNHGIKCRIFPCQCYSQKLKTKTFNELQYEEYHSKAFYFDLEKLPPTSKSVFKNSARLLPMLHVGKFSK